MIRPGFLDSESRQDLIELARDGSAAHRLGRRANALVLLDDGMSCEAVARVLLIDDDTTVVVGPGPIAEYLTETRGARLNEPKLMPASAAERAEARRLSDWHVR